MPNDGVVHEDECAAVSPTGKLSVTPGDPWFDVEANHFDLTGGEGDRSGILGWIRAMVQGG